MSTQKYQKFKDELSIISEECQLKDYHAFVYWFTETMYGWDRARVLNCLCDGTHDKGIDAVIIDEIEQLVLVIQSKYEHEGGMATIKDTEIRQFATVRDFFKSQKGFAAATSKANPAARKLLDSAYHCVKSGHFSLQLAFITTHKRSPITEQLVFETLAFRPQEFSIYDYPRIIQLRDERERNWTPPLGNYFLPYESHEGEVLRTEPHLSWVVNVSADKIRYMVNDLTPDKLFRKNVRNFLGKNVYNNRMNDTLEKDSQDFWYFNNGISILCDDASLDKERKGIRLHNPQIINGCQTAMTITNFQGDLAGEVLVRIIKGTDYDFINAITLYQNSSNPVKNRDFKSNDPAQIRLKQEFKRRGWFYYIKRGESYADELRKYKATKEIYPKGELNNEHVAKCLVAIDNPPLAISKGNETFFGEMYNSIFRLDISSYRCEVPVLLLWLIRDTYQGKKKFHRFKASTFKGRASYHLISLIYRALRDIPGHNWEKGFVFYWEEDNESWRKFFKLLKPVINEIFEIYYNDWKATNTKSKIEYDTFLERAETLNEVVARHSRRMNYLFKRIRRIFETHILIEPTKEEAVITAR